MSKKSQTVWDFTVSRPSQSLRKYAWAIENIGFVLTESCFKETARKNVETLIKIVTSPSVLLSCIFDLYVIFCKYPCFSAFLRWENHSFPVLRSLLEFEKPPEALGVFSMSCVELGMTVPHDILEKLSESSWSTKTWVKFISEGRTGARQFRGLSLSQNYIPDFPNSTNLRIHRSGMIADHCRNLTRVGKIGTLPIFAICPRPTQTISDAYDIVSFH